MAKKTIKVKRQAETLPDPNVSGVAMPFGYGDSQYRAGFEDGMRSALNAVASVSADNGVEPDVYGHHKTRATEEARRRDLNRRLRDIEARLPR